MLLDICFGTRTTWKILLVLAEAPGKAITRKEIRNLTKIGNKALVKFLNLLEKFDFIIVKKIGRNYVYKLNLMNFYVERILEVIKLEKKDLENLGFGIVNILREFVYELTNVCLENIKEIYIFGSYAKRIDYEKSDIDVAIIVEKRNVNEELLIVEIIEKIEKRFKKKIQPHYFAEGEFEKSKNKLVLEIKKDGIKLVWGIKRG